MAKLPDMSTDAVERRHEIILREVRLGFLCTKQIAHKAGVSTGCVRLVMWRAGYRSMQVTPDERVALIESRRMLATGAASPGGVGP